MRLRARAGQTATEYMLVISVIVCSLVAAAYLFIPEFQGGVADLAADVSVALATGEVGGIGFDRGGTSGSRHRTPGNGAAGDNYGDADPTPGGTASTASFGGPRGMSPSSAGASGLHSTASPLGVPGASQNANDGTPTLTNIHNGSDTVQPTLNHGVYHPGDPDQPVLNNGVYHGAPPATRTTIST